MKNIAKSIRTMLALLLVCALSASIVACGPEQTNTQISIDLAPSAYSISGGVSDEYIQFAVSVTNSENKEYTLTADHEEHDQERQRNRYRDFQSRRKRQGKQGNYGKSQRGRNRAGR